MSRSLICLTVLLLIASTATAADTYSLQANYKQGSKYSITKSRKMSLKGKVTQNGREQPMEMGQSEEQQYADEILDAQDGKPTKIRRKYTKAVATQEMFGRKQTTDGPQQGKTIEWEIGKDDKVEILSPKDLPQKVITEIQADTDPNDWLPKEPVAVGHKWTLDGMTAAKAFGVKKEDFKEGKLEGHFVEVVEHNGTKAAKIDINLTIKGVVPGQKLYLTMTIKGSHYIDLEKQLHLEGTAEGNVAMQTAADSLVQMKLEGPFSMTVTSKNE